MKKIALAAALGLAALVSSMGVQAASTSGGFNVDINLTSKCEITTGAIGAIALSYTSFQTTAATGTTNFDVRCTNTLPYTISLGAASVTASAGFGAQTASTTTGLAYSLSVSNATSAGTGLTAVNHVITGTIAAGLAGTCLLNTCTDSIAKTVYVNY